MGTCSNYVTYKLFLEDGFKRVDTSDAAVLSKPITTCERINACLGAVGSLLSGFQDDASEYLQQAMQGKVIVRLNPQALLNPEALLISQILLNPQALKELTENEGVPEHYQKFAYSLKHGTSSLYYHHFKVHGISATYPKPLEELILAIFALWEAHKKEIPMTGYFLSFKFRYMKARSKRAEIAMSFSNQEKITSEYTIGARQLGGEMMREIRHFIRHTKEDFCVNNPRERTTYLQMTALDHLFKQMPPMILEVSEKAFEGHTRDHHYEYVLRNPVKPQDINFIILKKTPEVLQEQPINFTFAEKKIQNEFIAKLIPELGLETFVKLRKINPYIP